LVPARVETGGCGRTARGVSSGSWLACIGNRYDETFWREECFHLMFFLGLDWTRESVVKGVGEKLGSIFKGQVGRNRTGWKRSLLTKGGCHFRAVGEE